MDDPDTGSGLHEPFSSAVKDEREAGRELARWKTVLPPVDSAYKPSGRLPFSGLVLTLLGALLGVPAGALATGLLLWLTMYAVMLVTYVLVILVACGVLAWGLALVAGLIGLAALILAFVVGGACSAACTTSLGQLGHNRNPFTAVSLSLASCAGAILLFWMNWPTLTGYVNRKLDLEAGAGPTVYGTILLLGALVALVTAALVSWGVIMETKYCEQCGKYMDTQLLQATSVEGLRACVRELAERQLTTAADLIEKSPGEHGIPKLFGCAECGRGHLELEVSLKWTWQEEGKPKEKTESWRVASLELTAEDVALFRPLVKPKPT